MSQTSKTSWEPCLDWLILRPVKLPNQTESGVVLPESVTKTTQGIVVKVGSDTYKDWLQKEVFFPANSEYSIFDTETEEVLLIVKAEHVIMVRDYKPQGNFFKLVERAKRLEIATLQPSCTEA